jgi:hypothetical protein
VKKKKMKKIGIVMVALVIVTFMIGTAALMMPALAKASEVINASGDVQARIHTTVDANGGFHSQTHYQIHVNGTGQTSGDTYQLIGVIHESINGMVGVEYTETIVVNGRIIGQGPGNNILVLMNYHLTVNPDGTVISFVDNFRIECR